MSLFNLRHKTIQFFIDKFATAAAKSVFGDDIVVETGTEEVSAVTGGLSEVAFSATQVRKDAYDAYANTGNNFEKAKQKWKEKMLGTETYDEFYGAKADKMFAEIMYPIVPTYSSSGGKPTKKSKRTRKYKKTRNNKRNRKLSRRR